MSRLPIRVRLTLGFAAAMAVVLAGVGLFVYQRVAHELLVSVDQTLVGQAGEEITSGRVDADTRGGTTLAQRFGPSGGLRRSQPGSLAPLVGRDVVAKALTGRRVWLDEELREGRDGGAFLLCRQPRGTGLPCSRARSVRETSHWTICATSS